MRTISVRMPRVTHWVRTRNPRLAQQQKVELEEGLVAGTAGAPLVYVILVLAATFGHVRARRRSTMSHGQRAYTTKTT